MSEVGHSFGALSPLSHDERVAKFGRFHWSARPCKENPERIDIDPKWQRENLVKIRPSQFQTFPHQALMVHKLVVDPFTKLLDAWEAAGLFGKILTWDGMWAPRFVRFSGSPDERMEKANRATEHSLSNHAWATAFDINVYWNRLGNEPAPLGGVGSVRALVPLAYEHGFVWGGFFRSRIDGQHFEFVGIPPVVEELEP